MSATNTRRSRHIGITLSKRTGLVFILPALRRGCFIQRTSLDFLLVVSIFITTISLSLLCFQYW